MMVLKYINPNYSKYYIEYNSTHSVSSELASWELKIFRIDYIVNSTCLLV